MDFKEIAKTPIADVAAWLGITLATRGEQLVGPCPISQLPNATAFKVTPGMNRFICFCAECKKHPKPGGDCIELVSRVRKVQHREAAALIVKNCGADDRDANPPTQEAPASSSKPSTFDPLAYLRSLVPDHEALTALGISPATLETLGGGYATKGVMRGRLALSIRRGDEILGFVGLALNGETPELLYPKDFKVPYFFGMQFVGEGTVYLATDLHQLLHSVENGLTSVICPLQPLSVLSLVCLTTLMKERKTEELEIL